MRSLLAAVLLALPGAAFAGADVQLDYAERLVDFHRFTDASGTRSAWGADLAATVRYRPAKGPWGLGAFYHQETFNLEPSDAYFQTVKASELGLDAVFQLDDKGLIPQIDLSYTAVGSITGTTVDPTILHGSQGGGLVTQGQATWAYEMHGVHVTPGLAYDMTKGAQLVFGLDVSMQSANLRSVDVRTLSATGAYKSYAKVHTAFDSYAAVIGARGEL